MSNICELCVHSNIDVKAYPCNECGKEFSMFKYDKQQLAAAHRTGWEQCQMEAAKVAKYSHHRKGCYCAMCEIAYQAANAIVAMKYKEPTNV